MRPLPKTGPAQTAVLRALAVGGPGTTYQIAVALKIPTNLAGAHLANLRRHRLVVNDPFFHQPPKGRPIRQIWRLA